MKINVKSTNLDLTPSLSTYIEVKLGDLGKLIKRYDKEGSADMRVEVGRTTRHHHKGDVYMAEVNLHLAGKTLRATEKNSDLRRAIDLVKHKLHIEIEKQKAKFESARKKVR